MKFKFDGHILRPVSGSGPTPPVPVSGIERLLFSSDSGTSSGTLSDDITNYDEIWIMHGLYDQYTITTLTNDYSSGFCLIGTVPVSSSQFLSYYMYAQFTDSKNFVVNNDGQWKVQSFASGSYSNGSSYKTQNLVLKIWGVNYGEN